MSTSIPSPNTVNVSFGEDAPLFDIMTTMRAMRRLKPDPVAPELLIDAAIAGPSGGNNQAFSFVVVTDREQITRPTPLWRRIVDWYVTTQPCRPTWMAPHGNGSPPPCGTRPTTSTRSPP